MHSTDYHSRNAKKPCQHPRDQIRKIDMAAEQGDGVMPTKEELDELQRKIDVMKAWADGKRIEVIAVFKHHALWKTVTEPGWDWTCYNYRIAPEPRKPREFYLHFDPSGGYPLKVVDPSAKCNDCVLFREVLPE